MIEKLAEKIVSWQIKKKYISQKDRALYCYAYGLLVGQAVNLLIACFLAILFHEYILLVVYLISYIPLRAYSGGHHATSYGICTIVSTVILIVVCLLKKILPISANLYLGICTMLIGRYFIFHIVPVEAKNKPLDESEKKKYRKKSIQIWGIEVVVWISLNMLGFQAESIGIVLAHLTLIVLLYLGIRKTNRRKV